MLLCAVDCSYFHVMGLNTFVFIYCICECVSVSICTVIMLMSECEMGRNCSHRYKGQRSAWYDTEHQHLVFSSVSPDFFLSSLYDLYGCIGLTVKDNWSLH